MFWLIIFQYDAMKWKTLRLQNVITLQWAKLSSHHTKNINLSKCGLEKRKLKPYIKPKICVWFSNIIVDLVQIYVWFASWLVAGCFLGTSTEVAAENWKVFVSIKSFLADANKITKFPFHTEKWKMERSWQHHLTICQKRTESYVAKKSLVKEKKFLSQKPEPQGRNTIYK